MGCVGDEPNVTPNDANPSDRDSGAEDASTASGEGDASSLAPDAAKSVGCPLGCLPPAPAGWTGPSAVFDGAPEAKPTGCPAPYTMLEVEAHQGMTAEPASCGCGSAQFQGAKCSANVEVSPSSSCSGQGFLDGTIVAPGPGACLTTQTSGVRMRVGTPTLTRGTCSFPSPTKSVPAPAIATVDVACGLPQSGTCESRPDCTGSPVPDAPFTRLCIHKAGDEACPSEDYSKRFVAFKSIDDGRTCSACTGTTTGGACGTAWGIGSGACSGEPTTNPLNTCLNYPGIGTIVNGAALAPSGIACTPAGGEPEGTAVDTEPVTFCCNK